MVFICRYEYMTSPTKRFCAVHFTPQMRSKHLNHDVIRLKRGANIIVIYRLWSCSLPHVQMYTVAATTYIIVT